MDLREYLFRKRLSQKEFAEKLGCTPTYLSQLVQLRVRPSRPLAKLIEVVTDGGVTEIELMETPLIPWEKKHGG